MWYSGGWGKQCQGIFIRACSAARDCGYFRGCSLQSSWASRLQCKAGASSSVAADVPVSFLYGHTAGHWGKHPALFLVCYCQKPICSSYFAGSVGGLVTASLELSACERHVTGRWLRGIVYGRECTTECSQVNILNSTGTGVLLPFYKIRQLFSQFETRPLLWGRHRANMESPGFTSLGLSPITLPLGASRMYYWLIDSVGICVVWVFTWLKEMNPQHLSS